MIQLGGLLVLTAIGYGFAAGGFLGAVTGFVVALGVMTSLTVLAGKAAKEGIAPKGSALGGAQRLVAGVAIPLVALGAYRGGWRFGWLWAIGGYALAMLLGIVLRLLLPPKEVRDVRRATRAFYRSVPSLNWLDAIRMARATTRDTDAIIDMVDVKHIPADRAALIEVQMMVLTQLTASRSDGRKGPPNADETAFLGLWARASQRERELGYITEEQELKSYEALRSEVFGLNL